MIRFRQLLRRVRRLGCITALVIWALAFWITWKLAEPVGLQHVAWVIAPTVVLGCAVWVWDAVRAAAFGRRRD